MMKRGRRCKGEDVDREGPLQQKFGVLETRFVKAQGRAEVNENLAVRVPLLDMEVKRFKQTV